MTTDSPTAPLHAAAPHTLVDDVQAVLTAIVLVSLGLTLLKAGGLATGGTPGLAFLLSDLTGWPLGLTLSVVNAPFYVLALFSLGWRFTLKTVIAMSALSVGVEVVHGVLRVEAVQPLYAAVAGGVLVGAGLLVLFRHRASLGGVNVLALALSRRFGWSTGLVQMAADGVILGAATLMLGPVRGALSLLGSLAINGVLALNHRPGRYTGCP